MNYNHSVEKDGKVYSIDRFTVDVYFVPRENLFEEIKESLDWRCAVHRQGMDIQTFTSRKLGVEKHIWQFDGLHIELWQRSSEAVLRSNNEDGDPKLVFARGQDQTLMRLDFNPNNCKENGVLMAVMGFLANCAFERPYCWSLSRVDYALDIPGKIQDFYILSRKMERFYETTRYYGDRKATGGLRVYDKRQERKDKAREDIGYDLVRFEWTQKGNRDFNFNFDKIAAFDPTEGGQNARLLKYIPPELINHALSELDKRARKKIRETCFTPLDVNKAVFEELLARYLAEYNLPPDLRRDWEKQFATGEEPESK